jgi:hypothetical protein
MLAAATAAIFHSSMPPLIDTEQIIMSPCPRMKKPGIDNAGVAGVFA